MEDAAGPFAMMDAAMARCPQPALAELRASSPVLDVPGVGVVLSRRADIDEVLRHPEVFSSGMAAVDLKNVRPLIPLQIDPPDHKKFRKVLDPVFAPRQMAALEGDVAQLVNDLVDRFDGRGEIDFAAEFSIPFPSQVFLTLLGLPLEELPALLAMKQGIMRPDQETGCPYGSEEADAHQRETAATVYAYFERVLAEPPAGGDDLLTRFRTTEVDGHRLTNEDILDICFLFLIAGLDTVTSTLDCMFARLAEHPEERRRLVDDPSSIPAVIEELLRWETPVMAVVRVATEDTEVGGCPIGKGDQVVVLISSANTDDEEFGDGGVVRFDREANRHLAFGGGIHRCLGSHLARMELRVALREWHRRIPDYSVRPGHELVYTGGVRSIDHFPMRLGAP